LFKSSEEEELLLEDEDITDALRLRATRVARVACGDGVDTGGGDGDSTTMTGIDNEEQRGARTWAWKRL